MDAILYPNFELSGFPFESSSETPRNATQVEALAYISACFRDVPSCDPGITPAGAFKELCGSSFRYQPSEPARMARYCQESMPLADRENIMCWRFLRTEPDTVAHMSSPARPKPYLDPALSKSPGCIRAFRTFLDQHGILKCRFEGPSLLVSFSAKNKKT